MEWLAGIVLLLVVLSVIGRAGTAIQDARVAKRKRDWDSRFDEKFRVRKMRSERLGWLVTGLLLLIPITLVGVGVYEVKTDTEGFGWLVTTAESIWDRISPFDDEEYVPGPFTFWRFMNGLLSGLAILGMFLFLFLWVCYAAIVSVIVLAINFVVFVAGQWWVLFNSGGIGMMIAVFITAPVAVPAVYWMGKGIFKLSKVLGTGALLATTRRGQAKEISMGEDLGLRQQTLQGHLSELRQLVPGQPPIPLDVMQWRGWLETLRAKAKLQLQSKTTEALVEQLQLVNQYYAECLKLEKHWEEIQHVQKTDEIRGLEREVQHKKLEVELKNLALENEQLQVKLENVRKPKKPRADSEQERLIQTASSIKQIDELSKALIEKDPERKEQIIALADDARMRIMEKGG